MANYIDNPKRGKEFGPGRYKDTNILGNHSMPVDLRLGVTMHINPPTKSNPEVLRTDFNQDKIFVDGKFSRQIQFDQPRFTGTPSGSL